MRRTLVLLAAFALVLGSVGQAAAANGAGADHAKLYYLSVGDSMAAGVQPIGDPDDMYRTDDGYAEQLLAMPGATIRSSRSRSSAVRARPPRR